MMKNKPKKHSRFSFGFRLFRNVMRESFSRTHLAQPLATTRITLILALILLALAIVAGCYHQLWKIEKKRYANLEDKYVRVRNMIGRESMQDLIDQSYLPPDENFPREKNLPAHLLK